MSRPPNRSCSLPVSSESAVAKFLSEHPDLIMITTKEKKCHPSCDGYWKISVYKDKTTEKLFKTAQCFCFVCKLRCEVASK